MTIHSDRTDNPQLDLLGGADAGSAEVHRLFFALMPDAATRERLAQAARMLKAAHPRLRARWIDPGCYHATLHFLGDHAALRQGVVDAAVVAAGKLHAVSFAWILDSAAGFRGRQPPCVLRSSHGVPEPLQNLWRDLRQALVLAGQGRHVERVFVPHVTVAYSHSELLDVTAIEPVAWQVDDLALIHNVVGGADYKVLARWPLRPTA